MATTATRRTALILRSIAICAVFICMNRPISAAPYASGVTISGTTVNFILNEPADSLVYSLNGGPAVFLDGSSKGAKSFMLNSASDTFSITAMKNDPIGYRIPTGAVIPPALNGLSRDTNEGGFRLISDDSSTLVRFNSPRGVTVAGDPNNPQFGTSYISNSAAGTTGGRTLGEGNYALRADQSDAFAQGDTARTTGFENSTSASSPFRLSVGGDHNVYIADFSDANGGVYRLSGTLTNPAQVLAGIGGPSTLPPGQNHGSTTAVIATGSIAGNNLTLYTVDEDLTATSAADRNSVWRYDIGGGTLPFAGAPTKVNAQNVLVPLATSDLDRGINGNLYLAQNRSAGNEAGIVVLSPDGSTVLFSSLTESRALLGDPGAADIIRNVQGMAVSLDQGWLAVMLNNSDVAVMPLDPGGIPNLAQRLLINTGPDINSGRDIAFDAAGNIHYVSSGQGLYRVLAPGGFTAATTAWNGSTYSFGVFSVIPEPSSALLVAAGAVLAFARRRRA